MPDDKEKKDKPVTKKVQGGGTVTIDSPTSRTYKGDAAVNRLMEISGMSKEEAMKQLNASKDQKGDGGKMKDKRYGNGGIMQHD
tara:strand:+ start:102 stop:353 length:252 start_codon:yes stop_codon:yes gene_type:complete